MTTITEQINEQKLSGVKSALAAAAIIHYPEEYRCPACDSLIPPTLMKREDETHPQTLRMTRKCTIYCGHCNAAFQAHFALRSGLLAQLDSVTRVDLDDLRKLKEEFGVITGDCQLAVVSGQLQEDEGRERRRRDREELYDRITATEMQLLSLKAAFRKMMAPPAPLAPRPAYGLADNLPGWEPSGSLDQETLSPVFDPSTSQV